jgi:hypothetical protein
MNASEHDRAMRAAFAPAHRLEPTDAEVARVLARVGAPGRRRALGRRTTALAVVGCLVAVAGAAAASGVLPIGTELPPLSSVAGKGEPRYTSNRVVAGAGSLPSAGRWQVTVIESDQGQCLTFERLDSRLSGTAAVCGMPSFDAISHGGGDELPDTTVVFGPAPERATAVRVTAPGGFHRTATTHEGTSDMDGDFYVIELPRKGLRNAQITWLDEHGRPPGPGMYVPSTIHYGPGPKESQRPH